MFHRMLIVASAEGFIIKGLETKLSAIGIAPVYSPFKTKEVESAIGSTDLVIIFADDNLGMASDSLSHIKKYCSENDEEIIVIGAKEDFEKITEIIPDNLIYKLYERPLDMENLMEDIEKYMRGDTQNVDDRRRTILIVDDDVSYMNIIMEWLKDKYTVQLANSGMQAITWLAKNHADLILLDYEMPVTSGPQVLKMLRSDPNTADIPVMFLTGMNDKDNIMKVLSLKPVGYQLKTVSRTHLRENLAKFFKSQKKQ